MVAFSTAAVRSADPRLKRKRIVLVSAALLLTLLVLVPCLALVFLHGFDGMYGQDAFAYSSYGGGPLLAALREWKLPPPFFFPPGYPLLIAGAASFGLPADAAALGWSLISGAIVPGLVFALAFTLAPLPKDVSRFAMAVVAGAAAAMTGQLWQSSVVTMSDAPALACATAGVLAATRYVGVRKSRWLALSAALLAAAVEIRLVYGLAVLAVALPVLLEASRALPRRRVLADIVLAVAVGLAVALPTWLPILGSLIGGGAVPFLGELTVHSWNPLNAVSSTFDTADGRLSYGLPMAAFYLSQPVAPYWFLALGVLIIPGIAAVARHATPLRVGVLLAWPALILGFLVGDVYQNTRFFLAVLPPLAVLVAVGSATVWHWLAARYIPARRVLAVVVAGALLINGILAARFTSNFIDRVAADAHAIRSLAAQVPGDAQIITLGAGPLLTHDHRLNVVELTSLSPESAMSMVTDGNPSYLLVDFASLRGQWAGRAPAQAVDSIERVATLDLVGTSEIWSLYRIRLLI